jgi:CheY-like chemotaxis protein
MSKKTVLIIEQDANLARQMTEILAGSGYETVIKEDGVSGLQAARDILPDAIVLCVEVPKMSGFAVCHKIKKINELQNIPLLLTSVEATEESFNKHKELKTRADAYLIKPYEPAGFKKEFDSMMKQAGAQADPGMSDAAGFDAILQDMDEHLDSEVSASLDNIIDSSFFEQGDAPEAMASLEFMPSAEIEIVSDEEPVAAPAAAPAAEEENFTMESGGPAPKPVPVVEEDWTDAPRQSRAARARA